MSPQQLTRLERLEQFVQRLTLGSYIAKAASEGGKILGNRRLLEQGEQVLAKAATAYRDPDALLALGEQHISDPTQMGIFSSHVAAGDLNSARDMLIDTRERGRVAKAVDAADQAYATLAGDKNLDEYDARASVSELTARFGALERTLASIETRLAQLERRPQAGAAAPVQTDALVAKAAGKKRRLTPEEDAESLMNDVERYVDDAAAVGALSSLIQAGELDKARPAIERARQAHETERIKAERRGFTR